MKDLKLPSPKLPQREYVLDVLRQIVADRESHELQTAGDLAARTARFRLLFDRGTPDIPDYMGGPRSRLLENEARVWEEAKASLDAAYCALEWAEATVATDAADDTPDES